MRWLARYYHPVLYALIALSVVGGIAGLVYFKWYRPKQQKPKANDGKVEQMPKPSVAEKKRRRA